MNEEEQDKPKRGRPPNPIDPRQAELEQMLRLSRKLRELIQRQVTRLEKDADGITGAGNVAKLVESLTKSHEAVMRAANTWAKQEKVEEAEGKSDDAEALFRELIA